MADIIAGNGFDELAQTLVDTSLSRDARDNVTVVAVRVEQTKTIA